MQPLAVMFFLILAELAIGGLLLVVLVDYEGIATKGFLGLAAVTYIVTGLVAWWARGQIAPPPSGEGLPVDRAWIGPEGVGFVVFLIAGVAETNRSPFDLPEAESELVAGYLTEYGGMRWGLFQLAEYANVITLSALGVTLFFGGFSGPGLPGPIWFAIKLAIAVFIFVLMRSARIRGMLASRYGPLKVASVYGPAIWLVMSLLVIPILLRQPPSISIRWWVQLFGHFPFVGVPIVAIASMGIARPSSKAAAN